MHSITMIGIVSTITQNIHIIMVMKLFPDMFAINPGNIFFFESGLYNVELSKVQPCSPFTVQ